MLFVFGFAMLVLAVAVVVLFAMVAELATRTPEQQSARRSTTIRPLEDARIGHYPTVWPDVLPDQEHSVLLVLSTICNSCDDVARQLVSDPGHFDWNDLSVVISTGGRIRGEEFITHHRLERFPHYIDEGGKWVLGEFGVQSSPTALVFHGRRLESAHEFNDVASLRRAVEQSLPEKAEENREKEEV